jgi:hypothetical protein
MKRSRTFSFEVESIEGDTAHVLGLEDAPYPQMRFPLSVLSHAKGPNYLTLAKNIPTLYGQMVEIGDRFECHEESETTGGDGVSTTTTHAVFSLLEKSVS